MMDCSETTNTPIRMALVLGSTVVAEFDVLPDALDDQTHGIPLNGKFFQAYFGEQKFAVQEALVALGGSKAYRLSHAGSDTDLRCVVIVDPRAWLGLSSTPWLFENKKTDCVAWDVGEFVKLLADGVPNMQEILWNVPPVAANEYGQALIEARQEFLTKRLHGRLGGFSALQMKEVEKKSVSDTEYPFKPASHALRVLGAAIHADRTGEFRVAETGDWANYLWTVKRGGVPLSEVKQKILELEAEWQMVRADSRLPEEVSGEAAAALVYRLRKTYLLNSGAKVSVGAEMFRPGTSTQFAFPDRRTMQVYVEDGNQLLCTPYCTPVKTPTQMGLSHFFTDLRKGNPLLVTAIFSPENERLMQRSRLGRFLMRWRWPVLTNAFKLTVAPFLYDSIRKLRSGKLNDQERLSVLSCSLHVAHVGQAILLAAPPEREKALRAWTPPAITPEQEPVLVEQLAAAQKSLEEAGFAEGLARTDASFPEELSRAVQDIRLGHILSRKSTQVS